MPIASAKKPSLIGRLLGCRPKAPAKILGRLVDVSRHSITGFVFDDSDPERAIEVETFIGDFSVGRQWVKKNPSAGTRPDQTHRFQIAIPSQLSESSLPEQMGVKVVETGRFIEGSPLAAPFDPATLEDVDLHALSEERPDHLLPPLDRQSLDEAPLTEDQRAWRRDGSLRKQGLIDGDTLEAYAEARWRHKPQELGWLSPTPYLHVPELMRLCCDGALADKLEELIGEPMGVHLNLTNWVSTERNWHQDDYLNPPTVNSWYAAVWVALDITFEVQ